MHNYPCNSHFICTNLHLKSGRYLLIYLNAFFPIQYTDNDTAYADNNSNANFHLAQLPLGNAK